MELSQPFITIGALFPSELVYSSAERGNKVLGNDSARGVRRCVTASFILTAPLPCGVELKRVRLLVSLLLVTIFLLLIL